MMLPSGNMVGKAEVKLSDIPQTREQLTTYYNGLIMTSSELLADKQYTRQRHVVKELELVKHYLKNICS
jgi:hypothetical protein